MAGKYTLAEVVGVEEVIAEAGAVSVARPVPLPLLWRSPRSWPLPWQKPLSWT